MVRSRMMMVAVVAVFSTVAIVADHAADVGQGALQRRARINRWDARHEQRGHSRDTMYNRDEMNHRENHENHHKMNHNDENMMEHHADVENGNGQGGHLFGDF